MNVGHRPLPRHSFSRGLHACLAGLAGLSLAVVAPVACKNSGQTSAEHARGDVQKLVELTDKDVKEVERGLPEGAKKLPGLLAKEAGKEPLAPGAPAVRSALLKMRQQVPDLGIAKSTFFAFADDKGIALRNDFEHDTMAGKDLVKAWPGLKAVADGAPFAATTGQFPGTPNPAGADKEWVAAVPVAKSETTPQGILVTGWTYRRFAYHLQVSLQRDVQDQLMRNGEKGKMPVLYVCLFDKDTVYGAGAPGAVRVPEVNEKELGGLGLHGLTEGGPAARPITITGRDFGWAAARLPVLGADIGVVVLRSDT